MRLSAFLAAILLALSSNAQTTLPLPELRRVLAVTYGSDSEAGQLSPGIELFVIGKSWASSVQNAMKWNATETASYVKVEMLSNNSLIVTLRDRQQYDSARVMSLIMQTFDAWAQTNMVDFASDKRAELNRLKNEAIKKVTLVQEDRRRLVDELRKVTGRVDVSQEGSREFARTLDTASQEISINQEGRKARIAAIQIAISRIDLERKQRVDSDPGVREMQKLADLRSEQLQLMQKKSESGTASKDEVHKALEELAETRIRVLQQKLLASRDAGLTQIDRLNQELLDLSLKAADDEAKVKLLRSQQVDFANIELKTAELADLETQSKAYTANIAEIDKSLIAIRVGSGKRVVIKDYNP